MRRQIPLTLACLFFGLSLLAIGLRHRRGNGLSFGAGTWDMAEKVNSPMDGEAGTTKYAKGAKSEAKLQAI
jgi:hypothetical protein